MARARDPLSDRNQVVAYFSATKPRSMQDVRDAMGFDNFFLPYNTYCAILSQVTKRGDLVRVARGTYQKPSSSRQEAA
jgi:predicted transcriptional regulator of viral defense system